MTKYVQVFFFLEPEENFLCAWTENRVFRFLLAWNMVRRRRTKNRR